MHDSPSVDDARRAYQQQGEGALALLREDFPGLYAQCLAAATERANTSSLIDQADDEAVAHHVDIWLSMSARTLAAPRLVINQARCRRCGEAITSSHRHDFVSCSCGATSADGGMTYVRRCWDGTGPGFDELSVYETRDQIRGRLAALPDAAADVTS